MEAFAGSVESTGRHIPHAHFLIWLRGALNPSELHARLKADSKFQDRFFRTFENMIRHHLPDFEYIPNEDHDPRRERFVKPPAAALKQVTTIADDKDIQKWRDDFEWDVKKLGERVQRHKCKPVCRAHKYKGPCRFLFPHKIEPESRFDEATNSVILRCLDPDVNYFNPELLVATRHNQD